MWGFHDRLLTLRKALHSLLTSGDIWPAIYRRWRFQSHLYNTQFGLIMSEAEWEDEWKSVLKLASSEPRNTVVESQRRRSRMSIIGSIKDLDSQGESSSASSTASTNSTGMLIMAVSFWDALALITGNIGMSFFNGSRIDFTFFKNMGSINCKYNFSWAKYYLFCELQEGEISMGENQCQCFILTGSAGSSTSSMMYESLEEIHVLALAHVLRRPIIVVADTILRVILPP